MGIGKIKFYPQSIPPPMTDCKRRLRTASRYGGNTSSQSTWDSSQCTRAACGFTPTKSVCHLWISHGTTKGGVRGRELGGQMCPSVEILPALYLNKQLQQNGFSELIMLISSQDPLTVQKPF